MGFFKGLLKIAVSLIAMVATVLIVVFIAPYVSDTIVSYTTVDDKIEAAVSEKIMPSSTAVEIPEELKGMVDSEGLEGEIPLQAQIAVINQAKIPEFLKQALLNNNNTEVYSLLGVDRFVDYVSAYIAKMVINILSFLVSFVVVTFIVKIAVLSLDAIAELPVIYGFNRIAGGVLGLAIALVFVWIGFLVITILYGTEFGKSCFACIDRSPFLTLLYEKNVFLKVLSTFR